LNQKKFDEIRPRRAPIANPQAFAAFQSEIRNKVQELVGDRRSSPPPSVKAFGTIQKHGYRIEKLTYETEPGIIIPSLLLIPENSEDRKPGVLYLNSRGKANSNGEMEALVKSGIVVLAIDARGWGETSSKANWEEGAWDSWDALFPNYDTAMIALLLGKSLVALRGQDVARGLDLLANRPEVDAERICGMGVAAATVPLLHQAVIDSRLKKVILEDGLISYETVEKYRINRGVIESVIPGVLKAYDLPDLVAALAPRPTWIVNARDPLGNRVLIGKVREQHTIAAEAFKVSGAPDALQIEVTEPKEEFNAIYRALR